MKIENNLARLRQQRGCPAAALAKQAGITRQSVHAMEAGDYIPNTAIALRLAQILEVRMEELFSLGEASPLPARTREVEMLPNDEAREPGQPVQLCRVDRRTVGASPASIAWHLPPADAVLLDLGRAGKAPRRAKVELFQEEENLENRLLIAGCDPAIPVLARHVQRAGVELIVSHRNSSQALELLRQGWIHIAGSHLHDEATGESNLPTIKKLFPKDSVAVFSFAVWEEGLVVAKGNPKKIRSIGDLARRGVSMINREPGAGCRILLDAGLRRAGIESSKVRGYDRTAYGHLPAAWQVRAGAADCCIATRAAARVFGLDFVQLVSERYDLVVRKRRLGLPAVQALVDTLSRSVFRRELEGIGGYDTSVAGTRVA